MLVLPILHGKMIYNVKIRIKESNKVRHSVIIDDYGESEIVVNRERLSNSSFSNSTEPTKEIDYIRSKSLNYKRPVFLTTKYYDDADVYDVYEMNQPPKHVSKCLDALYSKAILDMTKEMPRRNKGKYISLDNLDFDEILSDEKITKLQRVMATRKPEDSIVELLKRNNLPNYIEVLDFIESFTFTVTTKPVKEESILDSITAMGTINTKDYKSLNKYYQMSKSNSNVITRLSYVSRLITGKPLRLIHITQSAKQKVKRMEEAA